HGLRAFVLAVLGLPLLQVIWALAATLVRRDGWRLLRLLLTWAVSCVVLAGGMLYLDHGSLGDEQRYALHGGDLVWLPGAFVLGVLVLVANLGRGLWRMLRKKRKKRVEPAAATTAP